jgi:adenine deaminase
METPGGSISPEDVAEAMTWPGIIGLGEMMNFPAVLLSDDKVHAEMHATRHAGKVIGGHYASPELGTPFHGYVAGGPEDDHEGTRLEDAIARARQGMKVILRYGSSWHDVAAQIKAVTERGLDSRHFLLCTDDSHAATLVTDGHMDRVVRHAVSEGLPPMLAIQMATLNTAEHFGVSRDMGQIAPGRWADVVLVDDLEDFRARTVICRGRVLARDGCWVAPLPDYSYPDWVRRSVHLTRTLVPEDFRLALGGRRPVPAALTANVIGVIENQAPTRRLTVEVHLDDGELKADLSRDLAKIAIIDRHHGSGNIQLGLVSGFGFSEKCAIASTVAHDCHNLLVVGTDEACMAAAANRLAETGGGQVVVKDGQVIGEVQLPIAGLMSDEHAEVVARKADTVLQGFKACGCTLNNPNMQLSLLSLVVIPELRLSDKGLVDVTKFEFVPVLE